MKYIVFILFTISLIPDTLFAQTLVYDITSKDNYLGQLSVTKTQENDLIKIEATSEVNVHLFISINLKYVMTAHYKNNELIFSSLATYVNGKQHSSSITKKVGASYSITKDGHVSKYYSSISYSSALIYWKEPIDVFKVYSELDLLEKPIHKVGPAKYELNDPNNGHSSLYSYSNGTLDKAVINHTLLTFVITRR